MKRFCTLILLSAIASMQFFAQTLEELEKRIAAENHLVTKTQYDYNYVSGTLSSEGTKTYTTTYNHNGDIILKTSYNAKGMETGSEKYEYDELGNRTLYERTGNSQYKKITQYNSAGDIVLEAGYNGAENFRNEYSYSNGKLNSITYTTGTATKQVLEYSHDGLITTVKVMARGTNHVSTLKMKYDSKGNLLEETTLGTDGKEIEKKVYEYNSDSKVIKETKTRGGAFDYSLEYMYNSSGYLTKIYEETRSKKKYEKKLYSYSARGNLLQYEWRRNPDSEFNSKTYKYNESGICLSEETFYPKTNFKRLAKFKYTQY